MRSHQALILWRGLGLLGGLLAGLGMDGAIAQDTPLLLQKTTESAEVTSLSSPDLAAPSAKLFSSVSSDESRVEPTSEALDIQEPVVEGIPDSPRPDLSQPQVVEVNRLSVAWAKSEEATEDEVATETDEEWRSLIRQGDRLWLAGDIAAAEQLYRKAKAPGVVRPASETERPQPFSNPDQLSPEGRVYWREVVEGFEREQESRMMVGLDLLVRQEPDFVPGYVRYAEALLQQERNEEAIAIIEQAVGRMGNVPELVQAQVETLAVSDHLLEASIAARQFALLYPDHPQAAEFGAIADTYLEEFEDDLRDHLRTRAIANILTGTLSFALTGNLYGPLNTLQTTLMLLEGESGMGDTLSNAAARQLPLVEDEMLNAYINDIGQELAALTGRDDFVYEFFIVRHDALNAFALPGGKIFIFSGAILNTETEAELAGLIAHELAHTVLSHGFQMMADATLAGNTLQLLPYGGLLSNLTLLSYSRDMERQADAFGTRLLATAGYAADGLENLMRTLDETGYQAPIEWLSTHPDTDERIRNIGGQIERSDYNRFAFEGLERHEQMQERLRMLLQRFDSDASEATP